MKFNFLLILMISILTSCSTIKKADHIPGKTVVGQYQIKPGEVHWLEFKADFKKGRKLKCKGSAIQSYYDGEKFVAMVPETYFSKMKPFDCYYGKQHVAHYTVVKKKFKAERLHVDKKRVFVSKEDMKRVRKEQKILNKKYRNSPDKPYFGKAFKIPLDTYVTSVYGTKRIFNNKKQTQHLGTDFRAGVGVPIHTSNAGKVVIARDLFYTGNTITIDHGMGVFTIYGHLSELKAQEGEFVPKDALIGLAGKSGRVTGPHLHWGVKVNGQWVEGESLVNETLRELDGRSK